VIILILSLFIPTIRQGRRILSPENDKDVVYSGNSEDTSPAADSVDRDPNNSK
jgi:hypothetical protein